MKRTDIKAGIVYAIKSSYGPPAPIVFLEDGASGLYGRENYGRGAPRKLTESSHTKARRGRSFSETDYGYAALVRSSVSGPSRQDVLADMQASDPAAELALFLADKNPTGRSLRFEIVTSLSQIVGLYAEELAAYEAQQQADREQRDRKAAEAAAIRQRAVSVRDGLAASGIRAAIVSADSGGSISLRLDEAEKLLDLLRDREG